MPKSGAERTKVYRAKVKVDVTKYEQMKEKDRTRKRKARQALTLTEKELIREKNKIRHRLKCKNLTDNNERLDSECSTPQPAISDSPFSTKQSKVKTKKRLASSLPKSPRKRQGLDHRTCS